MGIAIRSDGCKDAPAGRNTVAVEFRRQERRQPRPHLAGRGDPLRGSLAIMSAITSTNSALSRGFNRRGSNGRSSQCARALSAVVPPGKGTLPVTA